MHLYPAHKTRGTMFVSVNEQTIDSAALGTNTGNGFTKRETVFGTARELEIIINIRHFTSREAVLL